MTIERLCMIGSHFAVKGAEDQKVQKPVQAQSTIRRELQIHPHGFDLKAWASSTRDNRHQT